MKEDSRRSWPSPLFIYVCLLMSFLLLLMGCSQETTEAPDGAAGEPSPTAASAAAAGAEPATPATAAEATQPPSPVPPTAVPPATGEPDSTAESTAAPDSAPGALIQVSMEGQVGVLLDEIPAALRDSIAEDLQERPEAYWLALAEQQVRLARNRLNFRNFVYPDKGQLPLAPEELWSIHLAPSGPSRQTIQGHDLVMIDYTYDSMLLSDVDSPGQAEPALAEVGGTWQEPFVFPADPNLLIQRTDNACINEAGFPPNSFDSENVFVFYDYSCEADSGGAAGCHRTHLPRFSCREALQERVGEVETVMQFERLAWDSELADAARMELVTATEAPDLAVVEEDLATNRVVYRYIEPDDCALAENAVGATGWRRLLQFSATVANVGGQPLEIGPVVAEDLENHVFTYSSCHDHFHYKNYGDFTLGLEELPQNSKQAFCVQSTHRFGNNESTPLVHDYSCRQQGIQAGWVDEYVAGLDTQWIDITDLDIPAAGLRVELTFTSNSDRFLCEGTAVLDENGDPVWEPSGYTTEEGESINRPQCDFSPDWEANNRSS
ncbi:MAG: lysyl oxidase family protein, partial [Candidatus Promineifilaceae bacterium]|nr:lysyl oxidase family protein [Candidatus Promineifilaceae bacterium]